MGQLGSALGNKTTFENDPQNFSGAEWGARFLGKGMQGLNQGMQGYNQQNSMMRQGGGDAQIPMTPQPQVQLPGMDQQKKPNPFFYGYSGGGQ